VLVIGVSFIAGGSNVLCNGNIWNVVLGYERYYAGGFVFLIGVIITIMAFKKSP
jgi:hypothetical protein